MGQPEGIRRHVPCDDSIVDETAFELLRQDHDNLKENLAHPEHGRVTILEKKVAVHDERAARMVGAAWVLLVVNGIVAFLAAIAAIYSTFK